MFTGEMWEDYFLYPSSKLNPVFWAVSPATPSEHNIPSLSRGTRYCHISHQRGCRRFFSQGLVCQCLQELLLFCSSRRLLGDYLEPLLTVRSTKLHVFTFWSFIALTKCIADPLCTSSTYMGFFSMHWMSVNFFSNNIMDLICPSTLKIYLMTCRKCGWIHLVVDNLAVQFKLFMG